MSGSHVFVLLIIALSLGYALMRTWMANRSETQVADTDADADVMLDKINALEERIQVLERIITDHDIDLRKEIDRL